MNENTIYANHMSISISQNDCCLTFNTFIPKRAANDKSSEIVDTENVILSLAFAKKLNNMLQIQIDKYETIFGPIQDLDGKIVSNMPKGLKKGSESNGKK